MWLARMESCGGSLSPAPLVLIATVAVEGAAGAAWGGATGVGAGISAALGKCSATAASHAFVSSGENLTVVGLASPIRLKESCRAIAQSSLPELTRSTK